MALNAASLLLKLNSLLDTLDAETAPGHLLASPYLDQLAAKTKLRRAHIVLGAAVFILFFVFVGFGASFFSSLIGFLFPMYASLKAIETKDSRDDKQWLTYWVIFALFSMVESFSDRVLFWFPMYYSVKILFLLFCQLPQTNGAAFIYDKFVGPWFAANQHRIDAQIHQFRDAADTLVRRSGLTLAEPTTGPLPQADKAEAIAPEEVFEGFAAKKAL